MEARQSAGREELKFNEGRRGRGSSMHEWLHLVPSLQPSGMLKKIFERLLIRRPGVTISSGVVHGTNDDILYFRTERLAVKNGQASSFTISRLSKAYCC
jgi:hypothetical protein